MEDLRLSSLKFKELTFTSEFKIKKEKNIASGPLEVLYALVNKRHAGR